MSRPSIYVTQPYLPPLDEFIPYLQEIWDSKILTNCGPMHQQLEQALCKYLGVDHIALFNNGTIALLTALQALDVTGEVITTPYSFVATAHSLLWNGLTPVFVDIDPHTLNLDPARIEAAITPSTTAIMPVHCYGTPCNVDAIQSIAKAYGLSVIYDAAHAFGVRDAQGSILRHGDLSVLSFHATKVFNTFEGGAIVCPNAETKHRIDNLKNFGFEDEVTVVASGINGKMSEVSAAFGLLQLRHMDDVLKTRAEIATVYRERLAEIRGLRVMGSVEQATNNSYFPVIVEDEYPLTRDELYLLLRQNNINARRYFYPLICDFPMYREMGAMNRTSVPVARDIANRVLCLPIYPNLRHDQLLSIIDVLDANSDVSVRGGLDAFVVSR